MNCQDAQMCAFVFKFERQMEMEDGYPGLYRNNGFCLDVGSVRLNQVSLM